ncbi:MAG TPA: lipopolysaccharide kinase InaA family protein [Candidatus Binatia bacterium]|nr:lipopolysaccharide kinase InaA family protein [Candidatus Binatia bacterium]
MCTELKYQEIKIGNWRLRVLPERWSERLGARIFELIEQQVFSKHPQTVRLIFPDQENGEPFFLKLFHPASVMATVKDYWRESKAFRSLRQGIALSRAEFLVPLAVAAGEERSCRILKRAFILTLGVPGEPIPVFLQHRYVVRQDGIFLKQKRAGLDSLARQIRRLHRLGFVHGDLVASNILVWERADARLEFYLMDNDRTRRYPQSFPQRLWKRNLIQLNRLPLAGISLQDRMRFFRAYSGRADWSRANRDLLRWLERKTRARRKASDAAAARSFRRLMSWKRDYADNV